MSRAALYCEGKNYFKVSTSYEFLIGPFKFYITKFSMDMNPGFHYMVNLSRTGEQIICSVVIKFDVFRKDVPFQDSYTATSFKLLTDYEKIERMKELLKELKKLGE